jgi:hypothetical protein
VIKIRYADLPQGLHKPVRSGGRRPVIYLLPGLSLAQAPGRPATINPHLAAGTRAAQAASHRGGRRRRSGTLRLSASRFCVFSG